MDKWSELRKWAESGDPDVPSWIGDEVLSLIEACAGPRKLYLIDQGVQTEGSYEITGIFSSRENADLAIADLNDKYGFHVQEIELDCYLKAAISKDIYKSRIWVNRKIVDGVPVDAPARQ
jgi:hypothetical protein